MSLPPQPSFDEFFRAVWGHDPYPWQRRLARDVVSGRWPDAIGVPTGTGKTSTLDVALFALAQAADLPPDERVHPRRIVVVVDRRTIVDQTFDRAVALRDTLANAQSGPVAAVAARLRAYMGREADQEAPVAVALLRGGLPRDDGWIRRPDQVTVVVSTVDQVGSRLLFRGYGVRNVMQSVHAGLLGHDTLLLLDEVHLSRPFEETLDAIGQRWRGWRDRALPDRWQIVKLSATSGSDNVFNLDDADLADNHLQRRLRASKPTRALSIDSATHKGKPAEPAKAWIDALVKETLAQVKDGRRAIGVVVNRVDTARSVFKALCANKDLESCLLTGRMRPCDRADVVENVLTHAGPDRADDANVARPFVCVATQCIEAGADLDFDGMVTEIASVDALVQRFGRTNRTGKRGESPIVVLVPRLEDEDPIYGTSLHATAAWLLGRPVGFNASTLGLAAHVAQAPAAAWPPRKNAAVLLPAHLDRLAQTSPPPEPDPDPALYLHGLEPVRPEVQVVWRADVPLNPESPDEGLKLARERLEAVPPSRFEALSLPLSAARHWLAREPSASFGDAGSEPEGAWERPRKSPVVGYVQKGDEWQLAATDDLFPHAVLVVPSSFGGILAGNFDPDAQVPVRDVGDMGVTLSRGRTTVRLDVRIHGTNVDGAQPTWPSGMTAPPAVPRANDVSSPSEARALVQAWIRGLDVQGWPWQQLRSGRLHIEAVGDTWVCHGPPLTRASLIDLGRGREDASDTAITADDQSSAIGRAVPLDEHLAGVESWARSLGAACGLPNALIEDLARAGRWHDLGKVDPRFQIVLHGGDEIRASVGPALAKSARPPSDRNAARRQAQQAKLPSHFRHEMASVALLTHTPDAQALIASCDDADLVLHLVASHHGYARPFAPTEDHRGQPDDLTLSVPADGTTLTAPADHRQDALDSGVSDRFYALQRRYGWWGLAWLESILRLADHRESEAESRISLEAT